MPLQSLLRGRRSVAARLGLTAGLAALLCVTAAAATAAPAYAPPAGWPDLGTMALASSDFAAGAAIKRQGYVKPDPDTLAEYDREFRELSVKLGGKHLLAIEDDVMLARSSDDADAFVEGLRLGLALVSNEIGKQFAKSGGIKVTYTKVGKAVSLGAGDNSVAATIRIGTRVGEIRLILGAVSVGQVDSAFYFAGMPRGKVGIAEAKRIARLTAAHVRATLVPANTVVPTITGTPQVGQTLTALPGTWLSFPTGYTYQWQRCDVTGANCAPVTGATGSSYVVAAEDVGVTLDVVATAQNSYGTGTATSEPTAVVTAVTP
jgi:hypothetical protein